MNKQNSREDNIQTQPLPDLDVTTEQADEIKAGDGSGTVNYPWSVPSQIAIITVQHPE